MASFQAKIGWKMPGKRKNKNYRSGPFRSYTTLFRSLSFRSVPTQREIENSKKIATKLKKLKHTIMASFQAKIG